MSEVEIERCGYAVVDRDGDEQPCDRPATGWRWYQDCGHEDMLNVACDWHANEGGRRIHEAEAAVERVRALADLGVREQWPPDEWRAGIRAALDGER